MLDESECGLMQRRAFLGMGIAALGPYAGTVGSGAPQGTSSLMTTVQDFGAKGDGRTDDAEAVQRAVTELAKTGGTLWFPRGRYVFSRGIVMEGASGFRIVGSGPAGTELMPKGKTAFDLFTFAGCRDSSVEGFTVRSSPSDPLYAAFTMATRRGWVSTHMHFQSIVINGMSAGGLEKGFRTIATDGFDGNNDLHSFYDVAVSNYGVAAWSFEHPQSKQHRLISCSFIGNQRGLAGVTTAQGKGSQGNGRAGGSFIAIGLVGGGNSIADFDLGAPNDTVVIVGGRFEESARLLQTGPADGNAFAVTIMGVSMGVAKQTLAPDGRAVIYNQLGPFVMQGNVFDGDVTPLSVYFGNPRFTAASIVGNYLRSTLPNALPAQADGVQLSANVIFNGATNAVHRPDATPRRP